MTAKEAAQRLGVSRGRVQQFLLTGRLAGTLEHAGPVSAWSIPEEEIDRFAALERRNGRPRKPRTPK